MHVSLTKYILNKANCSPFRHPPLLVWTMARVALLASAALLSFAVVACTLSRQMTATRQSSKICVDASNGSLERLCHILPTFVSFLFIAARAIMDPIRNESHLTSFGALYVQRRAAHIFRRRHGRAFPFSLSFTPILNHSDNPQSALCDRGCAYLETRAHPCHQGQRSFYQPGFSSQVWCAGRHEVL
jgi:hypothetical protein